LAFRQKVSAKFKCGEYFGKKKMYKSFSILALPLKTFPTDASAHYPRPARLVSLNTDKNH
jgi:hypothetical protein